ncbi:HNH endonuclease signature motif containing protein [Glutamicibacter creatinolyticus]|uniref:HNH endonuclease signature motif containing protein n=1 Tax=Glutamicibacter creatinolyticus TaxID=162496 RepID=UPI003B983A2A
MDQQEHSHRRKAERKIRQQMPEGCLHDEVAELIEQLTRRVDILLRAGERGDCAEALRQLESAKASYCAMQAKLAYRLEKDTILDAEDRCINIDQFERGAAASVAMARRQSQQGARSYLQACRMLVEDLPNLCASFERGHLSERQILAITGPLTDVNARRRREFDELFAREPDMFQDLGTKRCRDAVERFTMRHESIEKADRIGKAAEERHVIFTRGKDCVWLRAKLPLEEGVGLETSLKRRARRERAAGDKRSMAQLMTDLLTRQSITGNAAKLPVFVDVKLIMTDRTLLLGDREPAYLCGYGFVPAQYARSLVTEMDTRLYDAKWNEDTEELSDRIGVFPELQRLFTAPGTGELIAMDSKARAVPENLKDFLQIRDVRCRTPYCDNDAAEFDHITPWRAGGLTNVHNTNYRCRWCNQAKETPGWHERVVREDPHTIRITTPDGAVYQSLAPPPTTVYRNPSPSLIAQACWLPAATDAAA